MKKIGIIFAMEEELKELLKYLKLENKITKYNLTFYIGTIENKECILVQSGVGKVNAARTTQCLIDNFEIDCLFNIGVAGGISKDLNVFDIVIAEKLVQHDFDITAFNHEKGYIPDLGVYIKSDESLLEKAKKAITTNKNYQVHSGTIASGDIFCTSDKMTNNINKKFNALCVEMESAAIAQVATLSNVPFLILRSISDTPDNNNVITYDTFLKKSCINIAEAMKKLIKEL